MCRGQRWREVARGVSACLFVMTMATSLPVAGQAGLTGSGTIPPGWASSAGDVPPPVRGLPPGWESEPQVSEGRLQWPEAVRIAVSRYPSIAAARATVAQQASLVDAARAGYRPRVQAEVTSGEQGEFGAGQVATVGVSQMLYDFGKTGSAVARERAAEQRERASLLLTTDEVVEDTVHALVEVHRYQALLQTIRAQLAALGRVYEITRDRAQAGATSRSDPVQARARVEAVQARAIGFESQLEQWRSRLQTYVGDPALRPVAAVPEELLQRRPSHADVDRLPAVQVARARVDEASAALRNARAQRYPTVSIEANANRRLGQAGDRYEQIYGRSTYSTAFIAVRSDLYQGGGATAQVRASANALEAAQAQLEAERLLAADDVRYQREQVEGLRRRIAMLEARVASITETRTLYWDQYLSLGTRNALDLLNAEQEIGQSMEELDNARHDLWRAQFGHLLATGEARAALGLPVPDPLLAGGR